MLCHLPKIKDENLIVGLETSDDAAVYKLNENTAIIQTLDFFTPMVDDPYIFGQIAATNALSDVYAMGGRPLTAMNIVCFPNCLPLEILRDILKGGADKIKEAGALLVGGHSVEDDEPKYGLSVTGIVEPNRVLANSGAREGDFLIITKPIGLGVLNTAIKADLTNEQHYNAAVDTMTTLNKYAFEALEDLRISACTDITGFGLLGHTYEMAKGSGVSISINSSKIPILEGAKEFAEMGIIPAGMYGNRRHLEGKVMIGEKIDEAILDLMYDPQTSGGLLIAIAEEDIDIAVEALNKVNRNSFAVIGRVLEKSEFDIYIE